MPKNFITLLPLYLRGYVDDLSIGRCFHNGLHVEKDLATAQFYYFKAAKKNPIAAFQQLSVLFRDSNHLGLSLYYAGRVNELNNEKIQAKIAYKQALDHEHLPSIYRLGLIYQSENNINRAVFYFRLAAKSYFALALDSLLRLSQNNAQAAFSLGLMYEAGEIGAKPKLGIALNYYEQASRMKYMPALEQMHLHADRLNEEKLWLGLGDIYLNVFKKNSFAYDCYSKATQCGNELSDEIRKKLALTDAECAFKHALYLEQQSLDDHKALHNVWSFYMIAAKDSNNHALIKLECLARQLNNGDLWLDLGFVHQKLSNSYEIPLKCFQHALEYGNQSATEAIKNLANQYPLCAYQLALDFEQKGNIKGAYEYYVVAMLQGHTESIDYLNKQAEQGNNEAQFYLGYHYFKQKNEHKQSILWCMQAKEGGHVLASNYICNQSFSSDLYMFMAKKYECGDGVTIDCSLAIRLYQKACELDSKDSAFYLAQLYQSSSIVMTDNENLAYKYFLLAARLGCFDALAPLERIAKYGDAEMQIELGDLYLSSVFNNRARAAFWYEQAQIEMPEEVRHRLNALYTSGKATYPAFFAIEQQVVSHATNLGPSFKKSK